VSGSRGPWLQRELLRRLLLPVLVIVVLTGVVCAYQAQSLVNAVFDRWLLDAARSLAGQVRFQNGRAAVELTSQAEAMLTYDVVDRVSYEVLQDETHLLGQRALPLKGANERTYSGGARAYDGIYSGAPVRVGWVPVKGPNGEMAGVVVSETRAKRDGTARALVLVFAPVGVLVLVAGLVIGVAVRRTVKPLERMAAFWNERSHASLDAMPTQAVPRELMPFAQALNDLLARVRELLMRERHFASTAAHQLRTPLAGLQLGLDRAANCPDLASTRAALEELKVTTLRTARLLQQLLALSRLDPDVRGSAALVEVDLTEIARAVGEAYMDAAQAKRVELELDAPEHGVRVHGQPDLLAEALGNLIDNAIRHTPAGGRISVVVGAHPPELSVVDSGTGIRPGDAEKIFDRFVRGQGIAGEGSGLGLAVVKDIAKLHHAEVLLKPPAATHGAWFVIRFATDLPS
jgi:two-component system sensor histidine kinase TctE